MHAAQLTRTKLLTLAIGIPGGALFYLLHLPVSYTHLTLPTTERV